MQLPARINLVTLACRDVPRMTQLFRDLGWPETPESDEHHRTFQCTNGAVIALYDATHYASDFGPPTTGFRGITLGINLESFEEVERVYETLRGVDDVELFEPPQRAFWGGGFSWRDPEGNIWDVAWAEEATLDERGGVRFP
jgi:uncharacterized glyoxalase superfamily protein PhnB